MTPEQINTDIESVIFASIAWFVLVVVSLVIGHFFCKSYKCFRCNNVYRKKDVIKVKTLKIYICRGCAKEMTNYASFACIDLKAFKETPIVEGMAKGDGDG